MWTETKRNWWARAAQNTSPWIFVTYHFELRETHIFAAPGFIHTLLDGAMDDETIAG